MDFIICNGLGIYLGMKTCEYLSMKVSLRGWGRGGGGGYGSDQGEVWYVRVRGRVRCVCEGVVHVRGRVGCVRDGVGGRVR